MPRSKDPNKGKDEDDDENVSEPQQKSMFDYFKRKWHGRPKRRANIGLCFYRFCSSVSPRRRCPSAKATVTSVNHGLHTYQLKPEGMKGDELFAHMIQFRENRNWSKDKKFDSSGVMVSPRKYLDVEVKPDNRKVLKAATEAIVGGNITAKRNIL